MGRQKHPGAHEALREGGWWGLLRTCRCEIGTCDELWPAAPSSVWFHRRGFDRVVHDEDIRPRVRRAVAVGRVHAVRVAHERITGPALKHSNAVFVGEFRERVLVTRTGVLLLEALFVVVPWGFAHTRNEFLGRPRHDHER